MKLYFYVSFLALVSLLTEVSIDKNYFKEMLEHDLYSTKK